MCVCVCECVFKQDRHSPQGSSRGLEGARSHSKSQICSREDDSVCVCEMEIQSKSKNSVFFIVMYTQSDHVFGKKKKSLEPVELHILFFFFAFIIYLRSSFAV